MTIEHAEHQEGVWQTRIQPLALTGLSFACGMVAGWLLTGALIRVPEVWPWIIMSMGCVIASLVACVLVRSKRLAAAFFAGQTLSLGALFALFELVGLATRNF